MENDQKTYTVRFYSVVEVRADRDFKASSPEEAEQLARDWLSEEGISALDWRDLDDRPASGEVRDDEIDFAVVNYE